MKLPRRALVVPFALLAASRLAAQYVEPSVGEIFRKSSGVSNQLFGWAVAGLGDVNGDGKPDYAVSAPFASNGAFSTAGSVLALSGANGATLWSRSETRTSAVLGFSLETLDWNSDGVLDVVAGAPFTAEGRAWIFSGVDGSTLAVLAGEATDAGMGAAVATGGDFDGDGEPDLAVAAPFLNAAGGTGSGRVYVYRRGASAPFATLDGPYAQAQFGTALAFAGDTTPSADARRELAIGWRDALVFTAGSAGVYEWNGSGATKRYEVSGVGHGLGLGGDRMDGGADVDGDGRDDFLVGDQANFEVEVFSGASGSLLYTLNGAGQAGNFGAAHFVRDRNGDGRSEIAVGAWRNSRGGNEGGRVFLYSGADGALLRTITPRTNGLRLGSDVRDLGDLNGDGTLDLVVGCFGDGLRVFSGHAPAPENRTRPAQRPTDPALADIGGDPRTGPVAGNAFELFNLSLDCRNAPAAGPFAIRVRALTFPTQVVTSFGWSWIGGPLLFVKTGLHSRNVVQADPLGIVIPRDLALIGLDFGAQGSCGGRLSSALEQTIGG